MSCGIALETDPQSKLNGSRKIRLVLNLAESGRGEVDIRLGELGMVEQVEDLGGEFEFQSTSPMPKDLLTVTSKLSSPSDFNCWINTGFVTKREIVRLSEAGSVEPLVGSGCAVRRAGCFLCATRRVVGPDGSRAKLAESVACRDQRDGQAAAQLVMPFMRQPPIMAFAALPILER